MEVKQSIKNRSRSWWEVWPNIVVSFSPWYPKKQSQGYELRGDSRQFEAWGTGAAGNGGRRVFYAECLVDVFGLSIIVVVAGQQKV